MNRREGTEPIASFHGLTPDTVLDLVEGFLGRRTTSLCRPLNSYINRVFEVEFDDGDYGVAKFYRPGRWSYDALLDEHDFLRELDELEIPVVAPFTGTDGTTLGEHQGMFYTVFPRRAGRSCDEPSYEEWESLGRLLARVHAVGAMHPARARTTLAPDSSTHRNVEYILRSGVVSGKIRDEYERAAHSVIDLIAPLWKGLKLQRIHGDCHRANILYRPDEGFHLIDFDDMAVGPVVQDFWMLLPDYSRASLVEIDCFLEGYTTFGSFDRKHLNLIEPLRAMRYIHYTAWCAAQSADGGFARAVPGWGTDSYWQGAINDLRMQCDEIVASKDHIWM